MGMFDYLKIEDEVKIPVSKEFKSLKVDPHSLEFQTKDLDNCLHEYVIKNNKKLYKKSIDRSKVVEKTELIKYHGLINFGAVHLTDTIDYFLDYQAKFTNGLLTNIKLTKYESTTHQSREEQNKLFKQNVKKNKRKISNRLLEAIQEIFIKKPLQLLGIKLNSNYVGHLSTNEGLAINFFRPKITFLYKKEHLTNNYGISLNEITTEILFRKNDYVKEFSLRILGFGFKISKTKPFNLDLE